MCIFTLSVMMCVCVCVFSKYRCVVCAILYNRCDMCAIACSRCGVHHNAITLFLAIFLVVLSKPVGSIHDPVLSQWTRSCPRGPGPVPVGLARRADARPRERPCMMEIMVVQPSAVKLCTGKVSCASESIETGYLISVRKAFKSE